jgi:transcriptional regulator with XRE-family HTH domain
MRSSWIDGCWVPDEPFAARLKRLRQQANLTQEQLAEKSALDVGTIRQLEQGNRTNPQWQTVCALARGLAVHVFVFVGTEDWQPPESEEERRKREQPEKRHIIEADIVTRLEELGHLFNRRIDQKRRTQMTSMTTSELQQLAQELKTAPAAQKAITMIVAAICASENARQAEEESKYDALGARARVDMSG